MTDHTAELRKAGEAYQRARDEAERIMAGPRDDLTAKARAAYAAGLKKVDILRSTGHVWSGTWLDKVLEGIEPPGPSRRGPAGKSARRKA